MGVAGFGLIRLDGSEKPSAGAFRSAAAAQIHSLWPDVTVPPVETAKPTGWEWWDARTIAATTRCPEAAVREHVPRLAEQLNLCGIYEMPIMAAMLGTVAIETAHQFQPIHEFRNADGSIPDIWWTYDGGPEYHGRGFIQLTHRSNYRAVGWAVADLWGAGHVPDFDWVANPDNALQPDNSAASAACYFRDHGEGALPPACRAQNWREVRRLVQGGSAGLGDFTLYASTLVTLAGGAQPEPPKPPTDPCADYILALKTLRDDTIPKIEAQVAELRRIVTQFVGQA